jgi:malonyl-CoA/methylmalonyl-CoA synthetase
MAPLLVPSFQPFKQLLETARTSPGKVVLRDFAANVSATAPQLLHAVVTFQEYFLNVLSLKTRAKLDAGEDVFICLLAPAGWEFVVAMLAIRVLGAAVCPLCESSLKAYACSLVWYWRAIKAPVLKAEEAEHLLTTSQASALLYSTALPASKAIAEFLFNSPNENLAHVQSVPIAAGPLTEDLPVFEVSTQEYSPSRAATLIFTSGTSGGRPKGVVHPLSSLTVEMNLFPPTTFAKPPVVLHRSPVHWSGGFSSVNHWLKEDVCTEYASSVWSEKWFWERVKEGDVKGVTGPPDMYAKLLKYWEESAEGKEGEREARQGVSVVPSFVTAGAPLSPDVARKWRALTGKGMVNAYATTETVIGFFTRDESLGPVSYIENLGFTESAYTA